MRPEEWQKQRRAEREAVWRPFLEAVYRAESPDEREAAWDAFYVRLWMRELSYRLPRDARLRRARRVWAGLGGKPEDFREPRS